MTFDDILSQILDLLQRQGRVSYGALKRRFDLNDDYLNDLKDELLFAHPVVDEDNRGLVWTGETASGQEVTSHRARPPQQPSAQHDQPTQITPSLEPYTPEAERRQLTVMFCDLVDSTTLSSQLDPEEYRDVVRAYQQVCSEVITRFDGHIAQLLGDGLLVYFGYPHAHEDDAHRAVHAGLGMLAALGDLNKGLQQAKGVQLAIRIGVHTGLVVVGEMGGAGRQEQLALGEVPNIASRIEGLAAPNTIAISEASYRLVQGYFTCEALGAQTLRGVAEPITVYRVLRESGATSRLDVAQPRGLTPLVGRESEVTLLLERWEQAKSGHGQVILLTGDAGIGKSRLVHMLKEHVANEPHTRWECRSAEFYQNTALFPLVDLFQRILRFEAHATPDEKLGKLEQALSQYRLPLEESVQLFAPLFSLPLPEDRYSPLNLSPQRQRQKTLESLVVIMLELAEQQPVLFILEDLHWTDPTTLELLNLVVEQIPTTSMLMLLTCRPHFQPAWHHRSYLTEITVNRLFHAQVEQIVAGITDGKTFPAEVLQQIIEKTDGVPLFVEEITKAILESGQLKALDDHFELTGSFSTFAIPATLQDSLMARLDRLMTGKVIAQLGATIGRQFSYALLQAVAQLNERTLQEELHRLVEAELLYQRGVPPQATYLFKHALVVDAAYQSLLKSTRQQYHQRIAQTLEERFPEMVEMQPELLAYHFTEAGLNEQALIYWKQAGQQSMLRSAHAEAVGHFRNGLEVVQRLSNKPERIWQELLLYTEIGPALMLAKGQADSAVEHVYTQAHALCEQVGDPYQISLVLAGLWRYYHARGVTLVAQKLAEQCLTLARYHQDDHLLLVAHWMLGATLTVRGDLLTARAYLEEGIVLATREANINCFDPQQHQTFVFNYGTNPAFALYAYESQVLWILGYPELAVQRDQELLAIVQQVACPPSSVMQHNMSATLYMFCREGHTAQALVETSIILSTENGLAYHLAWGTALRGVALLMQHQEDGLDQLQQGLSAYQRTGIRLLTPYFLAMLAEFFGKEGKSAEGLSTLAEAFLISESFGSYFLEAELYRLQGELLLQQSSDNHTEAETCFQHSISIAQSQQAKSFELRAATSLARLWQQQGKRAEAHDLLAPVYNWFTEGFDTADLQDAKALLDELA